MFTNDGGDSALGIKIFDRQVRSNPLEGANELPFSMKDSRWSAKDGWVKMENNVYYNNGNHTSIHFVYNKNTGLFDDFKFKNK